MNLVHFCAVIVACLGLAQAYSKYGRTCKDIGCLSNEVCVMETDPCSYYQRQNECGSYPTCKRNANNNEAPSCKNYVCPPTKVCRLDGSTPKCVDDHSKVNQVGYDTSALNDQNQGNIYPKLPANGETTPRPNIGYQGAGGQGYRGGQVGSGYPGQARPAYPQQPYPGYNGYPQQQGGGGYPGYPSQGQQGYNNYNYNNQRYPNNYQQQGQGQYNPYGQQNRYGANSGSGSGGGIVDSLTTALKNYGMFYLVCAVIYHGWMIH